jgi:hypothetical protein
VRLPCSPHAIVKNCYQSIFFGNSLVTKLKKTNPMSTKARGQEKNDCYRVTVLPQKMIVKENEKYFFVTRDHKNYNTYYITQLEI